MINRLVAESTVKVPLKGHPYFSVSKKLLCFQTDNHTKIKALSRDAKDIQIPFNNSLNQFSLSQHHSWFYQLTFNNLLQIYQIQYTNGLQDGSFKKIGIIHNVEKYQEIKNGLILHAINSTIKIISFKQLAQATQINLNIQANALKSITQASNAFVWKVYPNSQRVILTRCKEEQLETAVQPTTEVFDQIPNTPQYEKSNSFTFLNQIIAIYKDRYVFQRKQHKQVEIYDLEESRLIGKFALEAYIKFSQIRENLLLIITNKQQTDYFNFFVLNSQPNSHLPLITNRTTYQKGKGDYYKFINLQANQANIILDKKKNVDVSDASITKISEGTASIVYALNKTKEKIQIIRIDHSKILKSLFGEQKLDKIVYSKKIVPSSVTNQSIEVQRSRIHSAIQSKNGEKTMEQLQKKFVQNLIDIKLKGVIRKFQQLEKKVENLQKLIRGINEKVESNLAKINRQEIRQNVDKLFDSLTPQFEKYFNQIFKQVAGVLDQGVTYYNMKLAKQADLHKEALTQIVTQTFKATEDIIHISKKEQNISEKTEQHLRKILDSKRKWTKTTEEYQSKIKQVPSPNLRVGQVGGESKVQGKVFVRADLNYPNSRRQG